MKEIIKGTSKLENHLIDFHNWKSMTLKMLDTIKDLDQYQEANIFDLTCTMLANHLKKLFENTEFYNSIEEFIISIKSPADFNQVRAMALKIDNEFFKPLLRKIKEKQNVQDLKVVRKSVTNRYRSLIQQYEENYRNTPSQAFPDIQELLCIGIYSLVKSSLSDAFRNPIAFYFLKYEDQAKLTLSSLVRQISSYPQQTQYFIAEILAKLKKTDKGWIELIIKIAKNHFYIQNIAQDLAADYVKLACSPPYCKVLNDLKQDKNADLRALLEEITPKITMMELPDKVFGRTFNNNSIVLKEFIESEGRKGATFLLYLRELMCYLQRFKNETIGDNDKNVGVRENDSFMEREIFGTCVHFITEDAADYVVSMQDGEDHEQFKKVFYRKNEMSWEKKIISLDRSYNVIILGKCGSKFGSIMKKPEKKKVAEEKPKLEDDKKND